MKRSESYDISSCTDLYSLWNVKLLETFFSPASKGDEVWLQVDPAELDSLGPELGGDGGFLNAVRAGPSWGTFNRNGRLVQGDATDIVHRLNGLVAQRQAATKRSSNYLDPEMYSSTYSKYGAPTYLPFLAALVRSASLAEDGFYDHLRKALGLAPSWGSQQMEALECAWKDLEIWTKQTNGEFGLFKFRTLGGYSHIGVPRSQSIMSRRDCDLISRVFAQIGARPGQQFSANLAADIKLRATESLFLTAGFRDALSKPIFDEPINARLSALFEDWDGKVPSNTGMQGFANGDVAADCDDIEICLSLQAGNQYPWCVHWKVPPLRDSGEINLTRNGVEWRAQIRGTESATTSDTSQTIHSASCLALSDSASSDVEFHVDLTQDGNDRINFGSIYLRKAILRVFVWDFNGYTQRDELREHALPLNGPAYLLAAAGNTNQLCNWLKRESIDHLQIDTAGLPKGWMLVCIVNCGNLTQEQRNEMPDGEHERDQHRVIRLVGGRTVRRAGIKQYMSYDLPIIELDAPEGTALLTSGLKCDEECKSNDPAYRSGIRRFLVTPERLGPRSYAISAVFRGRQLGNATLRVAADSGEQVEVGHAFSLNPQGNPLRDVLGLRGVLATPLNNGSTNAPPYFPIFTRELGRLLQPEDVARKHSSAIAQFLDTLAQVGSIAYGPARDQLARLMAKTGSSISPTTILLDLRGRGHIEIEINTRGHLARIYSVPPTLYQLAITAQGKTVFGVLGSLRHQHWESLSRIGEDNLVYRYFASEGYFDVWRILTSNLNVLTSKANSNGFSIQTNPALPIAEWAATREEVRAQIELLAGESIGTGIRFPERLSPKSGSFFALPEIQFPASGPDSQLFRMEDRDTGKLQTYALGIDRYGIGLRFGFVRDSRWGIWIALGAFAEFVKRNHNISEASPWPIPYSPSDGIFWLPARISLPIILERALNLCGGSGPESMDIEGVIRQQSQLQPQHIALIRKIDGKEIASVSMVYEGMATGRWLAYRFVPEDIAILVACKVGGTIAKF